jgi:hypothetical protein
MLTSCLLQSLHKKSVFGLSVKRGALTTQSRNLCETIRIWKRRMMLAIVIIPVQKGPGLHRFASEYGENKIVPTIHSPFLVAAHRSNQQDPILAFPAEIEGYLPDNR